MADLRALPPREEDLGCEWCHPSYDCYQQDPKFNRLNCPRVEGIRFLPAEECYYDKKDDLIWDIQAVSFKVEYEIEDA